MFKNIILASLGLLAIACEPPQSKDPIVIGMGLPLTGPMAEYGQTTKRGADLALEEINAAGGIHGRPLEIDFQDDQYDPKQAVTVAQKFIANPRILLASEWGTIPSMSVGSLYQNAGLVLFGFTTFHPGLTEIGDYVWSNAPSMRKYMEAYANYIADLKLRRVALLSMNNDLGQIEKDFLVQALHQVGVQIAFQETYLLNEKDFRPLISKAKAKNVDGFVLISFLTEASLIVQQIRSQGLEVPIVAEAPIATSKFPQLAGRASEGVYILGNISADDPRPEVVNLLKKWKARYPQHELEYFSAHSYDSIILAAEVLKLSDGTRVSVNDAMAQVKDVPSVIYGKVTFNPATRRVDTFLGARLMVKDGQLVRYETIKAKE